MYSLTAVLFKIGKAYDVRDSSEYVEGDSGIKKVLDSSVTMSGTVQLSNLRNSESTDGTLAIAHGDYEVEKGDGSTAEVVKTCDGSESTSDVLSPSHLVSDLGSRLYKRHEGTTRRDSNLRKRYPSIMKKDGSNRLVKPKDIWTVHDPAIPVSHCDDIHGCVPDVNVIVQFFGNGNCGCSNSGTEKGGSIEREFDVAGVQDDNREVNENTEYQMEYETVYNSSDYGTVVGDNSGDYSTVVGDNSGDYGTVVGDNSGDYGTVVGDNSGDYGTVVGDNSGDYGTVVADHSGNGNETDMSYPVLLGVQTPALISIGE